MVLRAAGLLLARSPKDSPAALSRRFRVQTLGLCEGVSKVSSFRRLDMVSTACPDPHFLHLLNAIVY